MTGLVLSLTAEKALTEIEECLEQGVPVDDDDARILVQAIRELQR